jgi:hypothetical protein
MVHHEEMRSQARDRATSDRSLTPKPRCRIGGVTPPNPAPFCTALTASNTTGWISILGRRSRQDEPGGSLILLLSPGRTQSPPPLAVMGRHDHVRSLCSRVCSEKASTQPPSARPEQKRVKAVNADGLVSGRVAPQNAGAQ